MNIKIPKPNEPLIDHRGMVSRVWLNYFMSLESAASSAIIQAELDALKKLVEDAIATESEFKIVGPTSVRVEGSPQSGAVVLSLAGDDSDVDPISYYGVGPGGERGFHPLVIRGLRDVDALAPEDGDALVWSASEGKWVPAPVSFSFGNPLTDEQGNILTDQDGNVLTDGLLSIDWADINNKPDTDGVPEGTSNLYYTPSRAQSVADSRIAEHVAQPDPHPQYQLESGLGSAAFQPASAFATAAQGSKADSAVQPGQNVSLLANNAGYLTAVPAASSQPWTAYTVSTLPSVTPAYRSIYVTDLTGNPGPCYSDGTNWRRYSDDSIAS